MRFIFFLTLIAVLFIPYSFTSGPDEWYPFVISEKLDPDSPANIGKLVLDPPAGKHGFVKVKDGHFYFEDGTRAKFWGTNLCFSACFPSKEQAKMLADRIAFFGFNAVRLHQMDFYFEPKGIFEDTNPENSDPQSKTTTVLSKKQLDRLDYLIFQLEKRGIYIDMNLLVSRHFTEADGVINADKLGMAAKPVSMFNPKLIELQKKYAKDLLTHDNPYTGLRYCDDPAVALVEITNENSLFMSDNAELPRYYAEEMQNLRKEWLGEAGKPDKIIKNDLYMYLEKKFFRGMTDFLKNNCGVKVPITGIGGYWNPEDAEAQESCDFIDKHAYWDHPSFPNIAWDDNDFRIQNQSMLTDNTLGIINEIKNAAPINKPYTITEWNHCYPNRHAYETPLLITAEAIKNNWDGLFQFDFKAFLIEHPQFNSIQNYFETASNPQQLLLTAIGSGLLRSNNSIVDGSTENGIFTVRSNSLAGAVGSIKDRTLHLGPFELTADNNCAVFLLETAPKKFIFIQVGEIRNKNSRWEKDGRFCWGTAPTLLKKIGITLKTDNKKIKIYTLDASGKRAQEILANEKEGINSFYLKSVSSPWFEIDAD